MIISNMIEMGEFLKQLRNPLPPKRPKSGEECLCLLCKKPFIMPLYTGHTDQVCQECSKTYRECASLVCSRCNVVICRIKPGLLDNGYYIRPYSVLHSSCCNICNPGLMESKIIEIEQYERVNKPRKIIRIGP